MRRLPAYPPFVSLANVVVSGADQKGTAQACIAVATWVEALVRAKSLRGVVLVGPAPCPIDRIKERWRWHFLIKTSQPSLLSRLARYVAERATVPHGVRLVVDRDPVALL